MLEHEKGISRDAIVVIPCDDGVDDARLLACRPDGTDQSIQITFDWGKGEAQTNKCLTATGHAYAWRAMMDDNFTAEKVIELIHVRRVRLIARVHGLWSNFRIPLSEIVVPYES